MARIMLQAILLTAACLANAAGAGPAAVHGGFLGVGSSLSSPQVDHPPGGQSGGLSDEHEADAEVEALCDSDDIRSQAEEMAQGQGWNGVFTEFTALKYKKQ